MPDRRPSRPTDVPRLLRLERVREYVIRDLSTLGDATGRVERPVDAEVDAALAVLLLGLREVCEAARRERPDVPVVARRLAVELVGRERERDVVGPEDMAQHLEERAAERRVARGVGRERRREVRSLEVAGRRAERVERCDRRPSSALPSPAPVGPVPASASRMPVTGRQKS